VCIATFSLPARRACPAAARAPACSQRPRGDSGRRREGERARQGVDKLAASLGAHSVEHVRWREHECDSADRFVTPRACDAGERVTKDPSSTLPRCVDPIEGKGPHRLAGVGDAANESPDEVRAVEADGRSKMDDREKIRRALVHIAVEQVEQRPTLPLYGGACATTTRSGGSTSGGCSPTSFPTRR